LIQEWIFFYSFGQFILQLAGNTRRLAGMSFRIIRALNRERLFTLAIEK